MDEQARFRQAQFAAMVGVLVYADPVAGLFVSLLVLKIAVSPHLTVLEAHEIGKRVKEKLLTFPQVHNVMVHINPYAEQ